MMNSIRVRKADLLEILKKNREQHRGVFLEAQAGYREAVIAELDKMLADARNGGRIRRYVRLNEPEDHTKDYDRAISMLEMDVEDFVQLDEAQYTSYVEDNWGWGRSWAASTMGYVTSASNKLAVDKYADDID